MSMTNNFLSFGGRPRRLAEADSVAVIGLGRFGSSLALELMSEGTEVLGVDISEELVQEHNGLLTQVVRADATRKEVMQQLAIEDFDRVVVAIGSDIKASILTASLLLQMDSPQIWAKAVDDQHGLILQQLGVPHVVHPEKDMGRRVAHLVRSAAADYLEIDNGYAMIKRLAPTILHEVPLGQSDVRSTHHVTICAYRSGEDEWRNVEALTQLRAGDTILVVGPTRRVEAFAQLP
jgi:trk system potassium uptake protein TrkA